MPDQESTRRSRLTLRAIDPVDGKECQVFVSFDRMQAVGRRSLGHAKECGYIVPAILQHPTAIFEGLRRDADEDTRGFGWRCYCGVPAQAFRSDGTAIKPYTNQVFLVFVNDQSVA